jgi:hypothetical protein
MPTGLRAHPPPGPPPLRRRRAPDNAIYGFVIGAVYNVNVPIVIVVYDEGCSQLTAVTYHRHNHQSINYSDCKEAKSLLRFRV